MPDYDKTIVCLANSKKMSGRCVAGKSYEDDEFGEWIRPISDREHGEVSEQERQYEDGSYPKVLEIISIPMKRHQPHTYQQENHVINADYYWERRGRLGWDELQDGLDEPDGALWINGYSSTSGTNDRIPEGEAAALDSSLNLIVPERLHIWVGQPGINFGNPKRQVRADFRFQGSSYNVVVTDPAVTREYFAGQNGTYAVPEAVICVSLGEPMGGYAYKLAACLITPQRAAAGA